ncbi:hypothetical protein C8T65DRAFT_743141 [Cerioporus squamosus]|nr:hypothetical protein C8T65DRAFT_743141 [Cerioporus squamosus]
MQTVLKIGPANSIPTNVEIVARSNEFKVLYNSMHGVTGPYGRTVFIDALGLLWSSLQNTTLLPDFSGGHPGSHLTYTCKIVERVEQDNGAFVTCSDGVAIIADWVAEAIPYFKKGGIHGLVCSMPTSTQIDLTGWNFFGNLMEAGPLEGSMGGVLLLEWA